MGTYWVMLIIETGWAYHSEHRDIYSALTERNKLRVSGQLAVVLKVDR